jgi:hypothetical protein
MAVSRRQSDHTDGFVAPVKLLDVDVTHARKAVHGCSGDSVVF